MSASTPPSAIPSSFRAPAPKYGRVRLGLSFVLAAIGTAGCSSGPMDIQETYYLKEVNGRNDANFYRIRIEGSSRLGVAEFRQGWHPAEAVDALFGDVSQAGAARALTTREDLRQQIDDALVRAQDKYLTAAADIATTPEVLSQHLEAIRRIRMAPLDVTIPRRDDVQFMEYNPRRDLITAHDGQKLVMLLSSNPEDIITKLADLSEDTKTEQIFNKFTDVIAAQTRKEKQEAKPVTPQAVAAARAKADVRDQATANLIKQMDAAVTSITADRKKEHVLAEIDALQSVLRSFPD